MVINRKYLIGLAVTLILSSTILLGLPSIEEVLERYPPYAPSYWYYEYEITLHGYSIWIEQGREWVEQGRSISLSTDTLYSGKPIYHLLYNFELFASLEFFLKVTLPFAFFIVLNIYTSYDTLTSQKIKAKEGMEVLYHPPSTRRILIAVLLSAVLLPWMRIAYFNLGVLRTLPFFILMYALFWISIRLFSDKDGPWASSSILDGLFVSSIIAFWLGKPVTDLIIWLTTVHVSLPLLRVGELYEELKALGCSESCAQGFPDWPIGVLAFYSFSLLVNALFALSRWLNLP